MWILNGIEIQRPKFFSFIMENSILENFEIFVGKVLEGVDRSRQFSNSV